MLLADDDTFFDLARYGTGKSDVNRTAASGRLLPRAREVRLARAGLVNAAAQLAGRRVLDRTLPLSFLAATAGAELSYALLDDAAGLYPEPLVTAFLPLTPDVRPRHRALQPRPPLDAVLAANASAPARGALYHAPGSLGRLAKPARYHRLAAWVLPWDDTVSGYVAQRALWEAGRGLLAVPGMDVWRRAEDAAHAHADADVDGLEEVVEFVENVRIPQGLRFVDEVFLFLVDGLRKRGLVDRSVVTSVRRFHSALRRRGVARLVRRPYLMALRENVETAVCVTGQMRSAAFTARNIMETLTEGIAGGFDVFVVTERDDRSAAARLFNATSVWYSTVPSMHDDWIRLARNSAIVHETMSSEREIRNYLRQLWDMRECERSVRQHEAVRGRKYRWMVRTRPDTVFTKALNSRHWTGRLGGGRRGLRMVVYGKRHSFYAMNDRFFAGDRSLMGRLMSCHDLFGFLVKTGRVYTRKASGTHMMFKKMMNSERFLGRCGVWKRVALKGIEDIEVKRVALSDGVAKWREF